jgi:GYF domain 2
MSETNSEIVWYIAREGEQHGPLSDAEMKLFVTNGHLKPTDLVWNPEMADWQTAASVFPPPAPPSPPPPPATPKVTSPAPQGTFKQPAQHDSLAAQNRTPGPALQVEPGLSAAAPSAHVTPSADAAHASLRPEPSLTAGADMAARQPAPVEGYEVEDEDDEPPRRRGRIGLLIGTVAVAAAIAGGGVVAFQNKDAILSYMNEPSEEANTPVVKAETNTKTAALEKPAPPKEPAPKAADSGVPQVPGITVTVPTTQPVTPSPSTTDSVPLETIDRNLQKSELWNVIKTEFPDWYKERVQEISKLSNTASETDLSKHLISKLVALRREHAKHALSSSTEHLQSIAGAFLANLKSLAGHSTDACYTFISKGETSPAVISLFPKRGYGDAIEGQIAAVFRAVADGRKSPVKRDKATKPDYDILSSELTKIGWSKADVGLFANPQALAKAPPEQVCKMVQDWFAAHIAINDKQVQERLLVETLRPVVAG